MCTAPCASAQPRASARKHRVARRHVGRRNAGGVKWPIFRHGAFARERGPAKRAEIDGEFKVTDAAERGRDRAAPASSISATWSWPYRSVKALQLPSLAPGERRRGGRIEPAGQQHHGAVGHYTPRVSGLQIVLVRLNLQQRPAPARRESIAPARPAPARRRRAKTAPHAPARRDGSDRRRRGRSRSPRGPE